jgi:GT2 family glycosyltransferase
VRVLAHITTFNEAEFIEQALAALRRQSRPPDAIIIVDNGSTDGTVDRVFAKDVTVIRNSEDLGASGAIRMSFAYALEHGFDWTWVFDVDSVPEPDALENLLAFFDSLSPSQREQVCFLACQLVVDSGEAGHRPILLTGTGFEYVARDVTAGCCRCDCFIWSGSLFRMPAVEKVGLPSADYFMDLAELEYGYRARQVGLTGYVVENCLLHHDVGRPPGVTAKKWRFGPFSLLLVEMSPLRCYYHIRNLVYFWLYQCRPYRPRWVFRSILHALIFPRTFAVRPVSHAEHLFACFRGAWDGLTGHMERRY